MSRPTWNAPCRRYPTAADWVGERRDGGGEGARTPWSTISRPERLHNLSYTSNKCRGRTCYPEMRLSVLNNGLSHERSIGMKVRFSHLSLSERRKIERWRQMKLSPDEMAHRLGRHRSTIFRELRRNHFHDSDIPKLSGYWCIVAQSYSDGRRTRRRKLVRDPGLRDQVERCLRSGWTPEQIAGRMRYEGAPRRVCQETIYRHVYSDEGRRAELWRHLPSGRRRRRGYRLRKRPPPKFAPELSILFRPDVIAHRKQFGHWEASYG
ncbi:hypothetical protein A6J80_22495 (plasmid) [Paracoccus yeei]|uniref:Transposase IS30-like HTH domain-containing protein n=1 Tax=Paracoccus yeei TaxID=147645 RepID=A0A1V0GYV2_9RHOB|nr:hypothetical protein A6J80_22495 [Paracoccus yeei]